MNADRIAEIRERLDKATPGPWVIRHATKRSHWSDPESTVTMVDAAVGPVLSGTGNDAELAAHAPDDLAFLLDLVASGSFMPHIPESQIVRLPPPNDDDPAPVPSGEVEAPCATCGGTREVADYYSRQGADNGFSRPCPDCGVETPGAAVEAGAKIYAYWRQRLDPNDVPPYWMTGPLAASIRNAREFLPAVYRVWRADLIAQGWTPPGGTE